MPREETPDETDEDIVASYKNGDEEAFKKLINRYTSMLFNFTSRLTSRNDASDIVQEIFIKTWKNIHNFDPSRASFKTWIFTVAKNTATDFLRKKKTLVFSDLSFLAGGEKNKNDHGGDVNDFAENIPAEDLLPDAALEKLENSQFLNKILESLRTEYREVLVLHYQEEMTFEEIGKILDKSPNTVKSHHRRAILELRNILK